MTNTRQRNVSIDGDIYTFDMMMHQVSLLRNTYPCIRQEVIGHSVCGRPILALGLGTGLRKLHANASVHANEWITTPILLQFVEELSFASTTHCGRYGDIAPVWLDKNTLWIVPMVNPDGVNLVQQGIEEGSLLERELICWNGGSRDFSRWKANIRGVDLNDQFPAGWEEERIRRGQKGPASKDYGGSAALTEPEAIALSHFTIQEQFDAVLSLHTQGKEIYWNYRDCEPPEAEEWAMRLGRVSGYLPVQLTDSDAGYKDWFIQYFRRPGFTIEAGVGVNPLPVEQFEQMYQDISNLLAEWLTI
ncbi:g-D-glutamyl-meso-diaminopimelate peptidase [Paenibacillus shirakamiensis]|uniref:G-D-glutamyl-meso-diaminopimelate peptidase n=1 Tax=Paenibacillus shirakamiensis TaxID=1265935 RepID=A0ABS4JHZ1_9BACL|nr:M14 family metallocarboxypeptidase [Paenibacillus shirakamiensis]MBP2001335.1 g-D-glutamyl-meso-diaminopimelate peptidase [Paenibacillus shirakamiensis]